MEVVKGKSIKPSFLFLFFYLLTSSAREKVLVKSLCGIKKRARESGESARAFESSSELSRDHQNIWSLKREKNVCSGSNRTFVCHKQVYTALLWNASPPPKKEFIFIVHLPPSLNFARLDFISFFKKITYYLNIYKYTKKQFKL